MEWVAAVGASIGIGVMAAWIYAGLPSLQKGRLVPGKDTGRTKEAFMVGSRIARRTYNKRPRAELCTAGILAILLVQVQAGAAWAETVTLTPPYAESSTSRQDTCSSSELCVAEATADHTTGELSFNVAAATVLFGGQAHAQGTIVGTHTLDAESNAIDYRVNVHITELHAQGGTVAGLGAEASHTACSQCRSDPEAISWLAPAAVAGEDVTLSFTLTNRDGGPIPQGTIRILARFGGTATVSCSVIPPSCGPAASGSGRATVTSMEATWNNNPVAVDDLASSRVGFPVRIDVLANDSDRDGDPLTVIAVSDPPNGSAVINADNTMTYDPDGCFTGTDTFTYTISDGMDGTDTGLVSVQLRKTTRPTTRC